MTRSFRNSVPLALLLSLTTLNTVASPYPDSGTIFREFKDGSFHEFKPRPKPKTIPQPKKEPVDSAVEVYVLGFEVHGNTQLTEADVKRILEPYTDRKLSTHGMHEATDALSRAYHQAGLFAAKVSIPPQSISNGVMVLYVYEGRFDHDAISLKNSGQRVRDSVLMSVLKKNIQAGEIIRTRDVEKTILLIEDMPGVHSTVALYPGDEIGSAKLHVETVDENLISGNIDFDNFGGYYTGRNRLGGTIYVNSPSKSGDQLTARLVTSGSDSTYGYLRYSIPVAGNGTRIGASTDYLDYKLSREFRALGSAGDAFEFRVFMTQPYLRTRHANFNWGLDYIQLKLNDHDDQGELAKRTINSGVIRINGDHDDDLFAAGTSYYSLDLTLGNLDINGNQAYINFDKLNADTAGSFTKVNFMISRLQHLKGRLSAYMSLSGQYASKNLDSSQKFFIGGPFSVPGYPTGEASGDDAAVLHLDLRHDYYSQPWGGVLQASVFYTYGMATLYKDTFPGFQGINPDFKNTVKLQSLGLGFTQTWRRFVLKAMLGWQLGDNAGADPVTGADSDKSDKDYRAWVQGIYYF